jgi:hypothetical protein
MAQKIKAKIAAVTPQQVYANASPEAYRDAILLALCEGIIEEIILNAEVPIDTGSSSGIYPVT